MISIFLLVYGRMIKQLIVGSQYLPVKYHGKVKFLTFECNFCHKTFSKMESYARKQVKIHRNACCFCSPVCRTKYFAQNLPRGPMDKEISPVKLFDTPIDVQTAQVESRETPKDESGIKSWLGKLFGG